MKTRTLLLLVMLCTLFSSMTVQAEKVYRWVDDQGQTNFTNDPTTIPAKYREQAMKPSPTAVPILPPGAKEPIRPQNPDGKPPAEQNLIEQLRATFLKVMLNQRLHYKMKDHAQSPYSGIAPILMTMGGLVIFVGWIFLLIAAARLSFLWFIGIFCCGCGPVALAITHWEEAKTGFLIWLAGFIISCLGYAAILLKQPLTRTIS